MNPGKAIETLKTIAHPVYGDGDHVHQDALKLGIEALKIVLELRQRFPEMCLGLLPGETKD